MGEKVKIQVNTSKIIEATIVKFLDGTREDEESFYYRFAK